MANPSHGHEKLGLMVGESLEAAALKAVPQRWRKFINRGAAGGYTFDDNALISRAGKPRGSMAPDASLTIGRGTIIVEVKHKQTLPDVLDKMTLWLEHVPAVIAVLIVHLKEEHGKPVPVPGKLTSASVPAPSDIIARRGEDEADGIAFESPLGPIKIHQISVVNRYTVSVDMYQRGEREGDEPVLKYSAVQSKCLLSFVSYSDIGFLFTGFAS